MEIRHIDSHKSPGHSLRRSRRPLHPAHGAGDRDPNPVAKGRRVHGIGKDQQEMAGRGIRRFRTQDPVQRGRRDLHIGPGCMVLEVNDLTAHHDLLTGQIPMVREDLGIIHRHVDPGELMPCEGRRIEDVAAREGRRQEKPKKKRRENRLPPSVTEVGRPGQECQPRGPRERRGSRDNPHRLTFSTSRDFR